MRGLLVLPSFQLWKTLRVSPDVCVPAKATEQEDPARHANVAGVVAVDGVHPVPEIVKAIPEGVLVI